MKFCKTCGTLYAASLGVCPKCNPILREHEEQIEKDTNAPADAQQRKRQWISICIGVPALILFLYLVIGGLKLLSNR